jgi:hypothetical protein
MKMSAAIDIAMRQKIVAGSRHDPWGKMYPMGRSELEFSNDEVF